MSQTATPDAPESTAAGVDPLLDRNASLADIAALWDGYASKPGTVEAGRITAVEGDVVFVTVAAGKGQIAVAELGGAVPVVGTEVRVFIEQVLPDVVILSVSKARALDLYDRLDNVADRDLAIDGVVLCRVKGGLSVDIGLKAFLPDRRPNAPVGERGRFWVREWDERKNMFVLAREPRSLRDARDAARDAKKSRPAEPVDTSDAAQTAEGAASVDSHAQPQTPVELPAEGAVLTGTVVRLAEFGAFVELPGGATGLLHVKELDWGRHHSPAEVVQIGDSVEVKVLKVQAAEAGGKAEKIQLSRRALLPEPWATVSDRLRVGQKVSGPVTGLADYGAFVEVLPGIEGLVHVSELGWGAAPKHPKDAVSVGERLEAEVILIDPEKRHLKLSVKKLKPSPWNLLREKFPIGTKVRGTVKNLASFGVFVTLDAENGLDGIVHTNDLSWTSLGKVADHFKPGQEVEALVLGIDEERGRCSLGIKQLAPEPEKPSLAAFSTGQTLTGKVVRVKDFGAFVELAPGIEGLAHAGEMGLAEGEKPSRRLRAGQSISVTIASVDTESRRVGLIVNFPEAPAAESEPTPEPTPEPAADPAQNDG